MKKYFLLLALILPISVHAACNCDDDEDDEDDDGVVQYHPYSYVGVKVGTSNVVDPSITPNLQSAYGFYMGTRYTKLFAVEAEYTNLGRVQTANGNGYASAISIDAVHQIEMGGIDLVLKLGLARTSVTDGVISQASYAEMYGAGFEFALNRDLRMRLAYDKYRLGLSDGAYATFAHMGIAYKY